MDHKNTITGIIVFFVFIMFGGFVGIFAGYFLVGQAEAEGFPVVQKEKEIDNEQIEEQEEPQIEEVLEELPPIEISKLNDLYHVLDIWKEIIQRTANEQLTHKEAGKLIYTISSEMYKRNIPEEFSLFRLKNIIVDNGKGQLKELNYSNFTYDSEKIIYVDAIETYENDTFTYKLKFVNENENWYFAAQLDK
ncbi:hypothetical protein [Marinisporobacter balticus]|uniref:Uncharacterized protein n=1 Tax=Marinisporobacter balticus TaxID=2018667 RepID=A0A4R2KS26_9FIRM|nr:hypothetical protein [Marinisporobacter balticus]TCO73789.1 hypothetical protein EV214_11422 [Marinisporobacter balticus]